MTDRSPGAILAMFESESKDLLHLFDMFLAAADRVPTDRPELMTRMRAKVHSLIAYLGEEVIERQPFTITLHYDPELIAELVREIAPDADIEQSTALLVDRVRECVQMDIRHPVEIVIWPGLDEDWALPFQVRGNKREWNRINNLDFVIREANRSANAVMPFKSQQQYWLVRNPDDLTRIAKLHTFNDEDLE